MQDIYTIHKIDIFEAIDFMYELAENDYISQLPTEILIEIFNLAESYKELLILNRVSKKFHDIVEDKYLNPSYEIALHLNKWQKQKVAAISKDLVNFIRAQKITPFHNINASPIERFSAIALKVAALFLLTITFGLFLESFFTNDYKTLKNNSIGFIACFALICLLYYNAKLDSEKLLDTPVTRQQCDELLKVLSRSENILSTKEVLSKILHEEEIQRLDVPNLSLTSSFNLDDDDDERTTTRSMLRSLRILYADLNRLSKEMNNTISALKETKVKNFKLNQIKSPELRNYVVRVFESWKLNQRKCSQQNNDEITIDITLDLEIKKTL